MKLRKLVNLPYVPPPTQAEKDAAWRAAGNKPAPFKIICVDCSLGPVDGALLRKAGDAQWICDKCFRNLTDD
jgi:hypothetical protein